MVMLKRDLSRRQVPVHFDCDQDLVIIMVITMVDGRLERAASVRFISPEQKYANQRWQVCQYLWPSLRTHHVSHVVLPSF